MNPNESHVKWLELTVKRLGKENTGLKIYIQSLLEVIHQVPDAKSLFHELKNTKEEQGEPNQN